MSARIQQQHAKSKRRMERRLDKYPQGDDAARLTYFAVRLRFGYLSFGRAQGRWVGSGSTMFPDRLLPGADDDAIPVDGLLCLLQAQPVDRADRLAERDLVKRARPADGTYQDARTVRASYEVRL